MGRFFDGGRYIVTDEEGFVFDIPDYGDFERYFCTAANQSDFFKGQRFKINDLFEKVAYREDIDLSPIYAFMTRALESQGIQVSEK